MSRMSTGGRMDNLHGILVFLRVVDAGSLSAAARSLGVSTSAVSAALARLEKRLSTRLVNRIRALANPVEATPFPSTEACRRRHEATSISAGFGGPLDGEDQIVAKHAWPEITRVPLRARINQEYGLA